MKKILALTLLVLSFWLQPAFAAKCMLVMSYHQGYEWNDGVQQGVESVLASKCDLKIFYMDTKRNKTAAHARLMAKKAKVVIDKFNPDVLIAADDNASRYLVTQYYKNADLPVVFCAVNWDVSKYSYPYKNVTGMIEVSPIQPLIEVSRKVLGKITSAAYLGAKTFSEQKNAKRIVEVLQKQGIRTEVAFASSFVEWQKLFINSQQADIIMLGSNAGINDWNNDEAESFVNAHANKLLVTNHAWMAPFSMLAMTKVPQEQGEWAAEAALAIVRGLSPGKIPIRVNRKWESYINSPLLKKIGLEHAHEYFLPASEIGNQKNTSNYSE